MSHPDDDIRGSLYSALIEVQRMMQLVPGGMNGCMILCVVALAGMKGRGVNVSTLSLSLGLDRKTVRKVLGILIDHGFIRKDETAHEQWPLYYRVIDGDVQEAAGEWAREVYAILRHRLKVHCDALDAVKNPPLVNPV